MAKKIGSGTVALAAALQHAQLAVMDFETSGVSPHRDVAAGLGVYIPDTEQRFYININHNVLSAKVKRSTPPQLVAALKPFLGCRGKLLIAHNATFELRFLFRLGVSPDNIRCRVVDTLIWTHRCDENLRSDSLEPTTHDGKVTYGLKELTRAFYNENPPTIGGVTGGRNTLNADPWEVAKYCIMDCQNTYRLYQRAKGIIGSDPVLRDLTEKIDDPNNLIISKMMWVGILVDVEEAHRQRDKYLALIQGCRERIWALTKTRDPLDKPKDVLAFLRGQCFEEDLGYDPFEDEYIEDGNGSRTYLNRPSIKREYLLEVFERCGDAKKQTVIALLLAKFQMEQRINAFLRPLPEKVQATGGRLYPDRCASTLTSTRFSTSPNMQNLPGRADKVDLENLEPWQELLPPDLREPEKTRDIFRSKPGYKLVAADLGAAEPRYLSMIFQQAL